VTANGDLSQSESQFLRIQCLFPSGLLSGARVSFFTSVRFPALPLRAGGNDQPVAAGPERGEWTDEELLARIGTNDQEALGLLFQRYARVVRSIATRILKNATEAEDVVQDLFLYIQRKCSSFDSSKSSAGSWIVHMAYQRAIERRRYLVTRHFYNREDLQESASGVVGNTTVENDYSAEAVFGRNGLEKILGSLSPDQRETLRLHFFEGYTLAEISAKLGQPLGNVRHHYYRGLDRLRRQMFGRKLSGG
jgi:RNA polymerase sigma-70 factor, ECF subfamily